MFGEYLKIGKIFRKDPVISVVVVLMTVCFLALVVWSLFHRAPKEKDRRCRPQQNYISDVVVGTSNRTPANLNSCPDGYTPSKVGGVEGSRNNINYSTNSAVPFSQFCYKTADTVCDDTVLVGDIKVVKLKGDFPSNVQDICSKEVVGEDGYFPILNYFPDNQTQNPYWGQIVHSKSQDCDNVAICVKSGTRDTISPISSINVDVSSTPAGPCPAGYAGGGQPIVQGDCLKNPSDGWNFCYTR